MNNKYYVTDSHGSPYRLNEYKNTPRGGILLIAEPATLFSNRAAARAAIKRTLEFAKQNQYYGWDGYQITRAVEDIVLHSKSNY